MKMLFRTGPREISRKNPQWAIRENQKSLSRGAVSLTCSGVGRKATERVSTKNPVQAQNAFRHDRRGSHSSMSVTRWER